MCTQILRAAGARRGERDPEESPREESKGNQTIHAGRDVGRDQERGTVGEEETAEQRIATGSDAIHAGSVHSTVI